MVSATAKGCFISSQFELDRLLQTTSDSVILGLDGAWGIGKTYWWKNKSQSSSSSVYLSTFRMRSVQELESKLATELLATRFSPSENKLQKLFRELFGYSKDFLLGYLESKTGGRAPEGLLEKLVLREYLGSKVTTVCIDDIERTSIPIRELFGYIDYLRDEWKVNVLMIFNSDQFRRENRQDFNDYREKALDREYQFRQSIEASVQVASAGSEVYAETLTRVCVKHGVANIRIIRRAKYLVQELDLVGPDKELAGLDVILLPKIIEQVCESILVSCLMKFEGLFDPITMDDLKKPNFQFEKNNDTPELSEAKAKLHTQWGYLDDIDRILIRLVDNDNVDLLTLAAEIRRAGASILTRTQEAELTEIFSQYYHKNYADTLVPFVDGILEHAEKYTDRKWSINHINNVVSVLYNLELDRDADSIVTTQVREKFNSAELVRWRTGGSFPGEVCDQLAAVLDDIAEQYSDERPLHDILNKIAEIQGYNVDDLPRLTEFDDETWIDYFTSTIDGPQKAAQYFLTSNIHDPEFVAIKETIVRVLQRLSDESLLNRVRLTRYLRAPKPD